jgi:hypothetical protein
MCAMWAPSPSFLPENAEIQELTSVQTGANATASATKLGTSVIQRIFKAWLLNGVACTVHTASFRSSACCCRRFLPACRACPSSWMPSFQWNA